MNTSGSLKHRTDSVETLLRMPLVDDDLSEFSDLSFILLSADIILCGFFSPCLPLPFPLKTKTVIFSNVLFYISLLPALLGVVGSYPWESM